MTKKQRAEITEELARYVETLINPDITEESKTNLTLLSVDDTIQQGDVFIADGKCFEMTKHGILLGVYVIGQKISKSGDWYRPIQ